MEKRSFADIAGENEDKKGYDFLLSKKKNQQWFL